MQKQIYIMTEPVVPILALIETFTEGELALGIYNILVSCFNRMNAMNNSQLTLKYLLWGFEITFTENN